MSTPWNTAAIADKLGIPATDLGIETIAHSADGIAYESVLLYNKAQPPVSGVVTVPNYFGLRQQALEIAATTIGAGHAILVADVFGKTLRPANPDEALAAIIPLKKDRAELRKRMHGVLKVLREQSFVKLDAARLGACGFCFGGTAALEIGRAHV